MLDQRGCRGISKWELDTPCLAIDEDILEQNIRAMQAVPEMGSLQILGRLICEASVNKNYGDIFVNRADIRPRDMHVFFIFSRILVYFLYYLCNFS